MHRLPVVVDARAGAGQIIAVHVVVVDEDQNLFDAVVRAETASPGLAPARSSIQRALSLPPW